MADGTEHFDQSVVSPGRQAGRALSDLVEWDYGAR